MTGAQLFTQITSIIYQDANSNVPYSGSIAQYFIEEGDYDDLPPDTGQIQTSVNQKLKGLTDTISDLRKGVRTPLKFEFTPPEEKAIYPLDSFIFGLRRYSY